ncbi:MAG: hypothetical protein ACFCBW_08585 [Candidatus Competibacterales bacterium]
MSSTIAKAMHFDKQSLIVYVIFSLVALGLLFIAFYRTSLLAGEIDQSNRRIVGNLAQITQLSGDLEKLNQTMAKSLENSEAQIASTKAELLDYAQRHQSMLLESLELSRSLQDSFLKQAKEELQLIRKDVNELIRRSGSLTNFQGTTSPR